MMKFIEMDEKLRELMADLLRRIETHDGCPDKLMSMKIDYETAKIMYKHARENLKSKEV
jgi:hypothetical protein